MRLYRAIGTVLTILAACGSLYGAAQGETDVVAEIGGHKVTRAELEQKETARLLKIRSQYYQAEREAVDAFIDDYLLEQKALQEHLTVVELVKRDLESHIQDPTEDQLKVYYEGLDTTEPYDVVREKILFSIRQRRLKKARTEYVRALREQAGVTISLAAPTESVSIGDNVPRGPRDAKVQIVEFADYECPYCRQLHPTLKKLEHEFDGKISLVYMDMPLPMHPRAAKAAEATHCAGAQGHYWDVHDWLFEDATHLEMAQMKEHARALHLNAEQFDKCMDSGEQSAAVKKDLAEAQHLGLNSTPALFINGHFFSGAVKYPALRAIVEQELTAAGPVSQSQGGQDAAKPAK